MLPFPDYESFEYDVLLSKKTFFVGEWELPIKDARTSILLTRSCPYKCTFCFHPLGVKYRRRSMDNIFKEIDYLIKKYHMDFLWFSDEMLIYNDEYIKEFCKRITPYNITFYAQTRVDSVNREKLQALKNAGCITIGVGVESADNSILKSMKKNITVEQIENAFELSKEVGITMQGTLIFGDPAENEHTIRNTLNWRNKHKDYLLVHAWIISYPGSEDYKVACERGVIKDRTQFLRDGCPQVNISQLSDDDYWEMVDKIKIYTTLFNAGINVDVFSICLSEQKDKLNNLVSGNSKVVIWPATIGYMNLLSNISPDFTMHENVFLVNMNPLHEEALKAQKYGHIHTPDIIANENIQIVLCPSSNSTHQNVVKEIEEMCKRDYPSVKQFIKLADLFTKI